MLAYALEYTLVLFTVLPREREKDCELDDRTRICRSVNENEDEDRERGGASAMLPNGRVGCGYIKIAESAGSQWNFLKEPLSLSLFSSLFSSSDEHVLLLLLLLLLPRRRTRERPCLVDSLSKICIYTYAPPRACMHACDHIQQT